MGKAPLEVEKRPPSEEESTPSTTQGEVLPEVVAPAVSATSARVSSPIGAKAEEDANSEEYKKVENLVSRFPHKSSDEVAKDLRKANGHTATVVKMYRGEATK